MRGTSAGDAIGHAWVCDGYNSSNSYVKYELWVLEDCPDSHDPENFLNIYNYVNQAHVLAPYFHYNWGYTGDGNGYFSDSDPTYKISGTSVSFTFNINRKELFIKP